MIGDSQLPNILLVVLKISITMVYYVFRNDLMALFDQTDTIQPFFLYAPHELSLSLFVYTGTLPLTSGDLDRRNKFLVVGQEFDGKDEISSWWWGKNLTVKTK